jgi:hypothetical protein
MRSQKLEAEIGGEAVKPKVVADRDDRRRIGRLLVAVSPNRSLSLVDTYLC